MKFSISHEFRYVYESPVRLSTTTPCIVGVGTSERFGFDLGASPIRQETVSIRAIVAGEYTVNVNHYLATTGRPVPVSVKVEKLNPTVEVVYYDTVTLDHAGQESTAVRFKVAESGKGTDISHRSKSLIQLTRSVRRPG